VDTNATEKISVELTLLFIDMLESRILSATTGAAATITCTFYLLLVHEYVSGISKFRLKRSIITGLFSWFFYFTTTEYVPKYFPTTT
jgi:hypothetical protein